MIYQPTLDESTMSASAASGTPLPPGLAMLERATATLRAYCRAHGLDDYVIFHDYDLDLGDVDAFLADLDPRAAWRATPLLADAQQPHVLVDEVAPERLDPPGILHLSRHEVVLARWHLLSDEGCRMTFELAAAPSAQAFRALHRAVVELRRRSDRPVWQIFHGTYNHRTKARKPLDWADVLLPPAIVGRIDAELVGFFSEPVASLYRTLDVPYRRGVLMYGPPGNGKTSIIRAMGSALPNVPAILLRPASNFGDDDLQAVFRRWTDHAPAMLVIEDLDHVLKLVDLSQFLNLVDGIEGSLTGGLLLVATTNHPEQLDPALNNRPGRFDVVIEIPSPTAELRRRFFDARAGEVDEALREQLATETAGLSFSHLQEILRLAGLLAVHDGSPCRTSEHLKRATAMVHDTHRSAQNGFPVAAEAPFGLAQFRKRE